MHFFDALADALTDGVAEMMGGSTVYGRASGGDNQTIAIFHCHVAHVAKFGRLIAGLLIKPGIRSVVDA